jgi:hypothetical protein
MRQGWRIFALLLVLPFVLVVHGSRLAAPASGWNSDLGMAGASAVTAPITAPPGISPDASGVLTAGQARVGANSGRVGPSGGPVAEPAFAETGSPVGRAPAADTSPEHRPSSRRIHDQLRGRAPPAPTEAPASL